MGSFQKKVDVFLSILRTRRLSQSHPRDRRWTRAVLSCWTWTAWRSQDRYQLRWGSTFFGHTKAANCVSVEFWRLLITGYPHWWCGKRYLPSDFEDSGVLKRSSFSRKIHHPWRPWRPFSLPHAPPISFWVSKSIRKVILGPEAQGIISTIGNHWNIALRSTVHVLTNHDRPSLWLFGRKFNLRTTPWNGYIMLQPNIHQWFVNVACFNTWNYHIHPFPW